MDVYISINGVLRNFIQKFDYHYKDNYLDSESDLIDSEDNSFEYGVSYPVRNDDILKYYKFQSKEEYENFCFIEYALELFGHAGLSYSTSISDLNRLIYENKDINFTVIGVDEYGKAKPSTLFFLSKNGFLGNNIKFIKSSDIKNEWKNCDVWVTDNEEIINTCPLKKTAIKFETNYNEHIIAEHKINNLNKIDEECLKLWVKNISSILMKLSKNVVPTMVRKMLINVKK